jgi:hypothetical protein
MMERPSQLDGANVLYFCRLDERVRPSGRHTINLEDGVLYAPAYAAVCQYKGREDVYRFYCDDQWQVVTDMNYSSVEEAVADIENGYPGAAALLQAA